MIRSTVESGSRRSLRALRMLTTLVVSLIILSFFVVNSFSAPSPVAAQANTPGACNLLVPTIASAISRNPGCREIASNLACYANSQVTVEPQPEATLNPFKAPGDLNIIYNFKTIFTSPLNPDLNEWGVVLLRLNAKGLKGTLQGKPVTFILYGDTSLTDETPICQGITTGDAPVYRRPEETDPPVASALAGSQMDVVGRFGADWLLVDNWGWIPANVVDLNKCAAPDKVPEVDPTLAGSEPLNALSGMRAFYLETRFSQKPACNDLSPDDVPPDGMLVHTDQNQSEPYKVAFNLNGAEIIVGSTVIFRATANDKLIVTVLDGSATVKSGGQVQTAATGQEIVVPLGAAPNGLGVSGPPNPPAPANISTVGVNSVCWLVNGAGIDIPSCSGKPSNALLPTPNTLPLGSAPGQTCVAPASGTIFAANGAVPVRSGPGERYPVIGTVQDGQPVSIFGKGLELWAVIDFRGRQGWVPLVNVALSETCLLQAFGAPPLPTATPRATIVRPVEAVQNRPPSLSCRFFASKNGRAESTAQSIVGPVDVSVVVFNGGDQPSKDFTVDIAVNGPAVEQSVTRVGGKLTLSGASVPPRGSVIFQFGPAQPSQTTTYVLSGVVHDLDQQRDTPCASMTLTVDPVPGQEAK